MNYIKISNSVEIDVNAFKLLGGCTKRNDSSKIGYFGSGLKYAIAVLMREKIGFRVFSGTKEIKLSTVTETLRDQEFEVITVEDEKTSLTCSMGVDWKIWQAIREIYCNALDEEKWIEIEPDARMIYLIKSCTDFFKEVKLPVNHKLIVGDFKDKNILGMALNKTNEIVLSTRVFDLGKKQIVCTILEEWAHLDSGQCDETRGFQDYLIGQLVTMLENQNGIFL